MTPADPFSVGIDCNFRKLVPVDSVRLKMVIAYDGTNYQGWQFQKTGLAVQQVIELALQKLFPQPLRLHSSSRTDTGVHALGMVAHLDIPKPELKIPLRKLPLAVNAHLPEDIRIVSASRCSPEFHARFSAAGKQYRYFVWNHPIANPLLRHQTWLVHRPLDVNAIRSAARLLPGHRDFAAFAATRNYEPASTVRTLRRLDVKRNGPLLTFIIEADGFLYKMCRGLVGTLVQIGLGKFQVEDIERILVSKRRDAAGMTAPAHGLVLWKVFYPSAVKKRPA